MRRSHVKPIGLDAMEVLRIESGAPRPGADFATRAPRGGSRRPLPVEIGLPHLAPLDAGWFNGRRALRFAAPAPAHYLATLAVDADHVLSGASVNVGGKVDGRITSAVWSPAVRRVIGLRGAFRRDTREGDGNQCYRRRRRSLPRSYSRHG